MVQLDATTAILMGGIPALNAALYHRIRFLVGDPTAVIQWLGHDGQPQTTLILRDIEQRPCSSTRTRGPRRLSGRLRARIGAVGRSRDGDRSGRSRMPATPRNAPDNCRS